MFVCAGGNEEFNFARSIGIGLVQSAIVLSEICAREKVDNIIFIGSAGSYSKQNNIFDVFYSNLATQIESSAIIKNPKSKNPSAYSPLDLCIDSSQSIAQYKDKRQVGHSASFFYNTLSKFENKVVNSSNYITCDNYFANKMLLKNIELENMEFFSVLSVAAHFNLPCIGIFCVSNYCDEYAHRDFKQNHMQAKSILRQIVEAGYEKYL